MFFATYCLIINVLIIFEFIHEISVSSIIVLIGEMFNLFVSVSLLIVLSVAISTSTKCTSELNETQAIVHKIYLMQNNKYLLKSLKTLERHVYQRRQEIRSSFSTIDWNLLSTVSALDLERKVIAH